MNALWCAPPLLRVSLSRNFPLLFELDRNDQTSFHKGLIKSLH